MPTHALPATTAQHSRLAPGIVAVTWATPRSNATPGSSCLSGAALSPSVTFVFARRRCAFGERGKPSPNAAGPGACLADSVGADGAPPGAAAQGQPSAEPKRRRHRAGGRVSPLDVARAAPRLAVALLPPTGANLYHPLAPSRPSVLPPPLPACLRSLGASTSGSTAAYGLLSNGRAALGSGRSLRSYAAQSGSTSWRRLAAWAAQQGRGSPTTPLGWRAREAAERLQHQRADLMRQWHEFKSAAIVNSIALSQPGQVRDEPTTRWRLGFSGSKTLPSSSLLSLSPALAL